MSFRKTSNKHLRKHNVLSPMQKYSHVLRIFLEDNCTSYNWCSTILGNLRSHSWSHLYANVTSLQTAYYADSEEFLAVSQLGALVLKYPWNYREIGLTLSPKENAIQKFQAAERQCEKTNKRFSSLRYARSTIYRNYISEMQLIISDILGPIDDRTIGSILDLSAFGPGSNIGVGGNSTHLGKKFFSKMWSVTPSCSPYFARAILGKPHFLFSLLEKSSKEVRPDKTGRFLCYDFVKARESIESKLKYVSSNKLSFVPKTAKSDRTIAIEPLGNSFVQKGIDTYMRTRLKRFGCDLSDQTRNQNLARHGSLTNSLATIDLSSASDTISNELVRVLLPSDWWLMLNACRSPSYNSPEGSHLETRYKKFTSMGNGFCFPLESLIFLAAVRAINRVENPADHTHGVYGDDIIVSSDIAPKLISLLRFLGFATNVDKTFVSGPFRESCGADWYNGQDVRPVYLDYPLSNDVALRIFHNATYRSPAVSKLFTRVREFIRTQHSTDQCFLRPLREASWNFDWLDWCIGSKPFHIKLRRNVYSENGWADEWWDRANLNGAFDVPLDQFMASKWARWQIDEQRWSWKEHMFRPVNDTLFDGSVAQYWSLLLGSPGGELYRRRETRHAIILR